LATLFLDLRYEDSARCHQTAEARGFCGSRTREARPLHSVVLSVSDAPFHSQRSV